MNYWIISDTHFGHQKIKDFAGRPENFEELILKNLKSTLKQKDVLIHLGDFSWKNAEKWHEQFMNIPALRKYLIRGNHDTRSIGWYLGHGWDIVCDEMTLNIYGKKIVFSHKPIVDNGYDLNIHGHLHNITNPVYFDLELFKIKNDKQRLIKMEHDYVPVNLKSFVELRKNRRMKNGNQ